MISISQITKDALLLPPEERLQLAQLLWESLQQEQAVELAREDAEDIEEAIRRDAEMESGKVQGIPHEEVMAKLRKKYG